MSKSITRQAIKDFAEKDCYRIWNRLNGRKPPTDFLGFVDESCISILMINELNDFDTFKDRYHAMELFLSDEKFRIEQNSKRMTWAQYVSATEGRDYIEFKAHLEWRDLK